MYITMRPNGKRVTLATVAEHAGVSITTVSAILSRRDKFLRVYRPETIAKVQQTAERLGYRANLFATGLPVKRPPFFALVLQDFRKEALGSWHHWGYEGSLLAGAIWAAMERRLYPVTATIPRQPDKAALHEVARLIDGGVFGTIVRTPDPQFEDFLFQRYNAGHPLVVVFPRHWSAWKTNAIDVDNAAVGQTAAKLLAARRRKRWALVRYARLSDSDRLRCEHFLRVAQEVGATVKVTRVPVGTNESAVGAFVADQWKRLRPDGVFAPESVSSVGSLLACNKLGLKPAEDFDLVGCDCVSWHSAYLPAITCVDVSWEQVGMQAVEMLAGMYQHNRARSESILLRPRVVAGGTCPVSAEFGAATSV